MRKEFCLTAGKRLPVYLVNTAVVGSGAAGLNAADCLWENGQQDIALITEGMKAGTSRNTGSDKQTYYKLSLSGDEKDSVADMARQLFSGRCVDGDHALCEAALSVECFLKLVRLGVSFPRTRYGEFVGYRTDHDLTCRGTSIGPYTSKRMTECLERAVLEKKIPVFDKTQVIRVLTYEDRVEGLLCLNLDPKCEERFMLFCCRNVIYATGGPAGMYRGSVYPESQLGTSGAAFEAGVTGKNLTEWQFGLASIYPRWNVSGTYMQALPRFFSTNPNGGDEREFLDDFFPDWNDLLNRTFLKGYQWPFDVRRVKNGSSAIDLAVYTETCLKGRRVFLDFTKNPRNLPVHPDSLSPEARDYLEKAGAWLDTPIARLARMNAPAVDFYREKGIDLGKEPLEIALCAQHNNGGLSVDAWWQTNVRGFFAVGEAAASHGVYRPGGSALNAGQVGASRAAQYIAVRCGGEPYGTMEMMEHCGAKIEEDLRLADCVRTNEKSTVHALWAKAADRMSRVGGAVRNTPEMKAALDNVSETLSRFSDLAQIQDEGEMGKLFRLRDMLVSQFVYLSAMIHYAESGGGSRGSALYTDPDGAPAHEKLPEIFRFTLDDGRRDGLTQEILYHDGVCRCAFRPVRPIPVEDDCFENVWRDYRESGNVF